MAKPLCFNDLPKFYGLRDWVWDQDLLTRARWAAAHRPFAGFNPTLERVTNGR